MAKEQAIGLPLIGYADVLLKDTRVQAGSTQLCVEELDGSLDFNATCNPVSLPSIISTISGNASRLHFILNDQRFGNDNRSVMHMFTCYSTTIQRHCE